MKNETIRKRMLYTLLIANIGLIVLVIVYGRRTPTPEQAEAQIAATSSVTEIQAQTPAPVASESADTNRVTVDFEGVKPVIK